MINYDERGVPLPGKPGHDYRDDLISIRTNGPKDYLQAKDALRLAREIWPTAKISTTLLHYQRAVKDLETNKLVGGYAVVHVRIDLPDGSVGEAHGSETVEDFPEFLEKAETKALKRALTAAGIGIQFDCAEYEYESENPRAFKGAIGDAAPITTRSAKPTTTSPAVGYTAQGPVTAKGEPIDVTTGEIAPTEPISHKEQDWLILLDDTVKRTGQKSQVISAWTTICRAEKTPSKVLQERYKLALEQTK